MRIKTKGGKMVKWAMVYYLSCCYWWKMKLLSGYDLECQIEVIGDEGFVYDELGVLRSKVQK